MTPTPERHQAPYGTWISPITAEAVAAQSFSAGIEDIIIDLLNSCVYYAQKRPEEGGRSAIVSAVDRKDFFDGDWDARTQVHEYGGAAAVVFNSVLFFSNFSDKRVYRLETGGKPTPVTPENPAHRFADFAVHPELSHLVVSILEDHTDPHPKNVKTYLALINTATSTVTKLIVGADFYCCPRFSPNGKFLLWQQWYFPDMPFQSSEVAVAKVTVTQHGLDIGTPVHVAGKPNEVSAQDPNWASNECLFYVCDVSGYQNPWKFTFNDNDITNGKASPVLTEPVDEEFGLPQWWINRHASGALTDNLVAFTSMRNGRSALYICDLKNGSRTEVPTPYAQIEWMRGDGKGQVVMLGLPADADEVLVALTLDASARPQLTPLLTPSESDGDSLPLDFVSPGEYHCLMLPPDSRTCHITYYAPKNPKYSGGLSGEKPPIAVNLHGGPWYMESANLNWTKQFYTSRGWAVVDINYGGSTGFGRAFRETLVGKWGLLDIHDAHQAVLKLDALGLADARRAVVYGGSAGGYSVLQIATTLPKAFAAGSPHYGIGDMRKLDEILHKFEYYLCDRLMGGTWEECEDVWKERSPVYHADKVEMPLLILQGKEDTVIPMEQMIEVEKKLKAKGCKVELILFDGEGHGWRKASTVRTELERSLLFFNEVLGLKNIP
ncbi:alpha/beta-hydrolase [Dendrothele bispora CBS 962.96]|uniref:Alpha/beta-hydrolase n=1 Tax=Dendrothele bispora (strain CBS 962.96) TaxID=1314807 RepID=A0A4S8MXH4_DENBC|nr:alpha/beta-hydrolase [Dendrothele bispora CBS 962.96]